MKLRALGMQSVAKATVTERHFIKLKEDKSSFGISGRKPVFFRAGWWSSLFSLRSKKNRARNQGLMMGTKNNEVRGKKGGKRVDNRLDTNNHETLTNVEI